MEVLENTIAEWKAVRETFPGWRVVPNDRRQLLVQNTKSWSNFVSENDELPDLVDIQYVYELCWQFEQSLLPIWDNVANLAENCLKKYWPFPPTKDSGVHSIVPSKPNWSTHQLNALREQWIQISIYLLRYYRGRRPPRQVERVWK